MRTAAIVLAASAWIMSANPILAEEALDGRVRAAVNKAVPAIQLGLETFNDTKPASKEFGSCISCHHEGIGLTTLSVVGRRGFAVDEDLARTEAAALAGFFEKVVPIFVKALDGDEEAKKKSDPFGDISAAIGYLIGALADHGQPRSAAMEATALILLKNQRDDGRWTFKPPRVPMQSSDFTTTAMAVRVLRTYVPESHTDRANEGIARGRDWLAANTPKTTDDRAFRLLGLQWAGAAPGQIREALERLRTAQKEDGGWSQIPDSELASDAYATGLALFALNQGGGVTADDPADRRGLEFLLNTQAEDGTWRVAKRAKALQRYFDAGFPYGEDQFISLPGTCWATMAMALSVDPPKKVDSHPASSR